MFKYYLWVNVLGLEVIDFIIGFLGIVCLKESCNYLWIKKEIIAFMF